MTETHVIYGYMETASPNRWYVGVKLATQARIKARDRSHRIGKSNALRFNAFVEKHVKKAQVSFDSVFEYFDLGRYSCTKREAEAHEHCWMDRLDSILNGFNIQKTGYSGRLAPKTIEKMSETHMYKKMPVFTAEHLARLRAAITCEEVTSELVEDVRKKMGEPKPVQELSVNWWANRWRKYPERWCLTNFELGGYAKLIE